MAITVQERDQVLKIVAGLFNGAPGGAYLSDFSAAVEAGMTLSELARALAATNEFKQDIMGGKVTVEQQVAVLMNHFGVVADNVEGSAASQAHAFFTDSVNAKVDFGDIVYTAVVFLENDTSAEFAPFRDMLNNKAAVAVAHAENSTTIASVAAGQVILAGVTSEGPSTRKKSLSILLVYQAAHRHLCSPRVRTPLPALPAMTPLTAIPLTPGLVLTPLTVVRVPTL